jgi:hypothetical protein
MHNPCVDKNVSNGEFICDIKYCNKLNDINTEICIPNECIQYSLEKCKEQYTPEGCVEVSDSNPTSISHSMKLKSFSRKQRRNFNLISDFIPQFSNLSNIKHSQFHLKSSDYKYIECVKPSVCSEYSDHIENCKRFLDCEIINEKCEDNPHCENVVAVNETCSQKYCFYDSDENSNTFSKCIFDNCASLNYTHCIDNGSCSYSNDVCVKTIEKKLSGAVVGGVVGGVVAGAAVTGGGAAALNGACFLFFYFFFFFNSNI